MAKGYWVSCYRAIKNPDALAEYAKLAGPAIVEGGGTFLARGGRIEAFEAGVKERTVVVEFPSFEQALATHDGPGYQAALEKLKGAAERDFRVIEGVD
jgi:uncharacterized protein (DUF1330 family)